MAALDSRPPVLRGRADVIDDIVLVAERTAGGNGGGLTVVGEPGIGKTAVLAELAGRLRAGSAGWRVIELRGVEAEVELAWSGLAGLLDGLLDRLDQLAPVRAASVRAALAIERASEDVEPFAVALAARDLLVNAAEDSPVLVLVDDLPWIDPPTRRTLAYIARRLQFERVAIVSSRRAGTDPQDDTGPIVELAAVADDVADSILVDAGVTDAGVRRELIAASGGIPLVLVEAANLLDADQRAGRSELPDPLPIGRSGQRVVDLVLARLPTDVLAALVVAAAEPSGDVGRILAALAGRGAGLAELEAAEAGGVIVLDGDRVAFRHPLMRAAAYHDAPRADRRAAHRALAETLPPQSPARAWHLARAAVGPDESVARALDDAAAVTLRRGAPASAARLWELASRLSPAPAHRARRLRLAAEAILSGGSAIVAGQLLARSDAVVDEYPDADDVVERVRRQQLRCRLPPSSGGAAEPVASLRKAASDVAEIEPALAVDLLIDALAGHIRSGAFVDMVSAVEEAQALRDRVDDLRQRRIDVLGGALLIARGRREGEALLDRFVEMTGSTSTTAEDAVFLAEVLAPALGFLRRHDASVALLAGLEAELRARGAVRPLVSLLGAQALAHYARSFPSSRVAATEALALAEINGAPELASLAAGVLAMCSAVIGDRERCEQAASLLRDVPEPERRALGPIGLAYLAYHEGRLEEALAIYDEIAGMAAIGQGLVRWELEWIETLTRCGRRAEALALLAALADEVAPEVLTNNGVERARGMLADDDDEAMRWFAVAVDVGSRAGNRFAEARGELVWGERLRRARRRAEARAHLERAVSLFRAVGATLPVERAATELRAAGGVMGEDVASHQLITPHELQVARLVVGGASNRDLAGTLFISPRTVEAHLTSIFRKLGVRNRRELAARALSDPMLQP